MFTEVSDCAIRDAQPLVEDRELSPSPTLILSSIIIFSAVSLYVPLTILDKHAFVVLSSHLILLSFKIGHLR